VEFLFFWLTKDVLHYKIKVGVYEKFAKSNSDFHVFNHKQQQQAAKRLIMA